MLTFLDILIGFTAVMLGASLMVTILNQAVSALLSHRGGNLLWGLRTLFGKIAPGALQLPVLTYYAADLAEIVVTHPLVSDSLFSTAWESIVRNHPRLLTLVRRWQYATAIPVPELRNVLQHIADHRPEGMSVPRHRLLAADIRALLAAGTKLEDWFSAIEDRVKQRFTMYMRLWTLLFAAAVAGFGCIDAISLVQELSHQANERTSLAASAAPISAIAQKVNGTPPETMDGLIGDANKIIQNIKVANLDGIGIGVWSRYSKPKPGSPEPKPLGEVIAGVICGWLLISLGAPFWFNALSDLTSLRPVLAQKTDSLQAGTNS